MKKSIILTSLLVASVGLTSCGRKEAQINPSTTGLALTQKTSCEAVKKDDPGAKYNVSKFIDSKKSKPASDPGAVEYAKKVYANYFKK